MVNKDSVIVKRIETNNFLDTQETWEAEVIMSGLDLDNQPCRIMSKGDKIILSKNAKGEEITFDNETYVVLRKHLMLLNKTRFKNFLKKEVND